MTIMTMNQKTYHYTVHLEQAPDGVIIATVPALRGYVSCGDTLEEAERNIQEAVECYLEGLQTLGEEIPLEERTPRLPQPMS